MSLLELFEVTKTYRRGGFFGEKGRHVVLDRVSLALREGECLGLLGKSGSGKSTLGRIALGLESPDSGQVRFQGRPVVSRLLGNGGFARKDLQVVFQNSLGSVNPRFTAGEIIAEPLDNFERPTAPARRARVAELLQMVGLRPADAGKYPHQFSGGQMQRVCIARALAPRPRVVVLDEAVSSLDMLVQARILDLLAALRRDTGTSYLFISHDVRVLLGSCDRLAVLHEGTMVESPTGVGNLRAFRHPAFLELVGSLLPAAPRPAAP